MKCTGQSTATYSQPVTKSQKFDGLSQTRDNDLDTSSISGSWERQGELLQFCAVRTHAVNNIQTT